MKIRPKVFEDAMWFVAESEHSHYSNLNAMVRGCLSAIRVAALNLGECADQYVKLFTTLFWRSGFYWWPLYERGYTSRIIALQLAACVARDENKMKPINKGEYVLATKYRDGDPRDAWAVGFYDSTKGDRYFVIDGEGKQLRANGFRRIGKISQKKGQWLLNNSSEVERPGRSLWGFARRNLSNDD